jgi:tetratricopeptide (TPR) repeat protein
MKRVLLGIACVMAACHGGEAWTPAAERDTKDDPVKLRPGYGNDELHLWWPLTETEVSAVKGIDKARQGDVFALFDLAIVGSGDHRTNDDHTQFAARIDKFVTELKPAVDAADEWHKGYEINRGMHRVFFNGEKTDLGSYSLDQARLTGIFTSGTYNCISSAMLYAILARAFGLTVRGVVLPEHAFVELGPPNGKILEVETTSATGYDWVHDEKFYKEDAQNWSSKRGLKPSTLADYKAREIMEPHRLIAKTMEDPRAGATDEDHYRLFEIAALLAPEDPQVVNNVLYAWFKEGNDLYDRKAWRTSAKLFDTIRPSLENVAKNTKEKKQLEHLSWLRLYHARALIVVGRGEEAIAIMDAGVKNIDPSWTDYQKLRENYLWVLMDHLLELMNKKDYAAAVKFVQPRFDLCKSDQQCANNLGIIYRNQAVDHQNRGDWSAARAALKECVQLLPNVKDCSDDLSDLESRHSF